MFSEQWKPSLFAGISLVLIGICTLRVVQSVAPVQAKHHSEVKLTARAK